VVYDSSITVSFLGKERTNGQYFRYSCTEKMNSIGKIKCYVEYNGKSELISTVGSGKYASWVSHYPDKLADMEDSLYQLGAQGAGSSFLTELGQYSESCSFGIFTWDYGEIIYFLFL